MIRCLSFAKPIWTVSFGSVNIFVCLMSNGFECTKTTIIEYRSISWSKTEFSPILIGLNLENQKEWNDFTVPVLRMVVCSSWRYVIFFSLTLQSWLSSEISELAQKKSHVIVHVHHCQPSRVPMKAWIYLVPTAPRYGICRHNSIFNNGLATNEDEWRKWYIPFLHSRFFFETFRHIIIMFGQFIEIFK